MKTIGDRIKKLRQEADMSQQELAKLLQVARPAVSQIESGDRKLSAEELKKLSEIFHVSADSLLGSGTEPEVVLAKIKKKKKTKQPLRINVPQENVEKFREVLLYILDKVGSKANIGETVLYKLLYFMDFNFYEKYEEQLIGATYIKNLYGPTPIEFKKLVDKMIEEEEITKVKGEYFQYPQTKYLPLKKLELLNLKANELQVIDDVLNTLSDKTASQISEYSHKDVPWISADDGEPLEYESVFYRTPEYSVREYGAKEKRKKPCQHRKKS